MTIHAAPIVELTSDSPDRTVALGRSLASVVRGGDVVALDGPLGAGKTQLVRGLAEGLGGDSGRVSSPTFVIMQEYEGWPPLVHIDAYRLSDAEELEAIGFSEMVEEGQAVIVIEWAARVAEALPADHIAIAMDHLSESARRVTARFVGALAERAAQWKTD